MDPVDLNAVRRYAALAGFSFESEDQLSAYQQLLGDITDLLDIFDQIPAASVLPDPPHRDPGQAPTEAEDPLGAILRRISVRRTDAEGRLSGMRIGVKDAIAIAGIPLTAGSAVLADYVPEADSVVVERMLAAGAEVTATLNMDGFAWSGGANTSDYGVIRNPVDAALSAGGSSGGSAAALSYAGIDLTLGTDQAGSNRVPASWCGVLGLKPTHGLIPYTGCLSVDPTIDHVGPMSKTVADMATLMDVLAGGDNSDPRQGAVPIQNYTGALHSDTSTLTGRRIGVPTEGFDPQRGIETPTAVAVRAAADRLRALGADIIELSLPEHVLGGPLAFAFYCESQLHMITSGGNGYGRDGRYAPELATAMGHAYRYGADRLPVSLKAVMLAGAMLKDRFHGSYYARAQNLRPWLCAAYDRALQGLDALLLPTTPMPAFTLDEATSPDIATRIRYGWSMLSNTLSTDVTGHPALSMPAAKVGHRPVGAMLIGHRFDDATLLELAKTWEEQYGWYPHE